MATQETVTILRVDTGEAVKNVGDLKENVKLYKKQLDELEIGTQEYQDTLSALKVNQNALRDAMYATSASMDDLTKSATGASESYNSLVHRMAAMKEELRNIDISTQSGRDRFKELSGQINDVNDKLKNMDAAQGNFQRNVGNYEGALSKFGGTLKTMGVNMDGMINPIKNVTGGLKALSATPAVAIIGLIASLLTKVIGALKTSEENTRAMTSALSVFAGAGDLAKQTLQMLGNALAKVAEWVGNLAYKLFPALREAADLRAAATKQEIELADKQREVLMRNADDEKKVAELRAKVADKATYSAKERLAFLEEATDLEKKISDRNLEVAKREYELQKKQAEMAGNSREENDKLAQAYAKMVNAETAYYNKTRELNGQMSEARKAIADEYKKIKVNIEAVIDEIEDVIKIEDEDFSKQNQRRDAELKRMEEYAQNTIEYNKVTIDDAEIRAEQERQITAKLYEDKLAMLKQYESEAYAEGNLEKAREYGTQILDTERQIEHERLAEKQRIRLQDRKEEEENAKKKIATMQAYAGAVSGLLSSIADLYEANGEEDVKAQEKAKALRIAGATIDTIQGAITAYMTAQQLGPITGPIVGALNAAVVTATGLANIAKIRKTNVSGTSTSASASFSSVSAPQVSTTPQEVAVTSNTSDAVLNQIANTPQRVYILQSDIEEANKASKTQVSESTFA